MGNAVASALARVGIVLTAAGLTLVALVLGVIGAVLDGFNCAWHWLVGPRP